MKLNEHQRSYLDIGNLFLTRSGCLAKTVWIQWCHATMFELKVCQMSHPWCMQALGLSKWIDEFPGDFTFASDCRWPANRHIPFRKSSCQNLPKSILVWNSRQRSWYSMASFGDAFWSSPKEEPSPLFAGFLAHRVHFVSLQPWVPNHPQPFFSRLYFWKLRSASEIHQAKRRFLRENFECKKFLAW